jgi:hypothetical protein
MRHAPDEVLLAFARALRGAGIAVTHDRSATFLQAAARVGMDRPQALYWAGRATLCASPDDLDRFDDLWAEWFLDPGTLAPSAPRPQSEQTRAPALPASEDEAEAQDAAEVLHAAASPTEVLRHRDVADLTSAEKATLARMLGTLDPRAPRRRAHRRTAWHRGEVDQARMLRTMLRQHGEPGQVAWRRRSTRPRRVVLLIDVSGSMCRYADTLLRLAHRFVQAGGPVEVFTVGTRLTHVTRALRHHDAERALAAAGDVVPDWSGGTRLGDVLQAFLDRWGQRGMARGSVVVVFSDGWERGDCTHLGEQVARLRRLARRVVWVNPHRGRAGYEPVQGGIVAVLPHVDEMVAGHSLQAYTELCEVVARA